MEMASEEASSEDRLAAELKEARPDPEYVRSLLRDNGGGVPTLQRREVWALLLGVRKRDVFSLDDKIKTAAEDLENQRVILADAKRTRAHTEEFRSEEMQTLLVKLLTFYCKSNSLRYKQGLNEVLAPFIRVFRRPDSTVDDDAPAVFNALSAFIARFMPHMYNDEAFTALQAQNALFGMLLRYFDPELSAHLDSCGIIPELYASGWFMTLFAHSFPMDQLLAVWDAYIVANDPQLHTWCALLVLTGHRDRLLASDAANLPITLSDVKREERETQSVDVASLCARAIELKAGTPRSFLRDLRKACFAEAPANPALIEKLQRMHCIRVEPQELAHDLFASRIASSRSVSVSSTAAPSAKVALNFFVVDARHLDAFDQSHLMLAYHFPNGDSEEERVIDAIRSSIASGGDGSAALAGGTSDLVAEVLASLDALAAMRGRHLCIIPPSYADAAEGEGLSALLPTSLGAAAASTMSLLVSATMGTAEEAAIASPSSSLGTTTSEEARAMLCCTARLMFAKRLKHVSILGSGSFDGSFDEVKRLIELRAGGSDDLLVAPMPAEEREAMRAAAAASAAERDGVSSREGRRWGLGGLGSLFAARAPAGPAEETPPSSELGLADFGLEDNDAAALKATPTEAESGGRRGGGGGGWFSRFRVGGKGSDAMEEDSSDAGTPPLEKEKKGGIFSRIRSRSTSTGTEGDSDTTPQEGKGRWRPNLRKLRKSISSSAQLEAGVTVGLRRLRAMDPSSSIFRCRRVLQTTRVRATEGAATRGEGDEMPKASRKARLYPGRYVNFFDLKTFHNTKRSNPSPLPPPPAHPLSLVLCSPLANNSSVYVAKARRSGLLQTLLRVQRRVLLLQRVRPRSLQLSSSPQPKWHPNWHPKPHLRLSLSLRRYQKQRLHRLLLPAKIPQTPQMTKLERIG